MTNHIDQLSATGALREYRFASHTPLLGPLITRLRSVWYNVAARWGDQSIINQQTAFNRIAVQQSTEFDQRLIEFDQRLILTDRDLTDLARTVAELTQQVIQLQHAVATLQARSDHVQDQGE
jgi:uncharacterized coiled-coil protein SlyX